MSDIESLKKLISVIKKYYAVTGIYYKKYRKEYLVSSAFIVISSLLLFPIPILTRKLIDVISTKGAPYEISKLLAIIVILLLVARILSYIGNLIFFKLNSKINLLLRKNMVTRILKSRMDLFEKYNTGYLISRVNDDPGYLNTLFGQQIIEIFQNFAIVIISLVGIFYLSLALSLLILVVVPILIWTVIFFSQKMRSIFPVFLERRAYETSSLQESLNAFMFLKIALREIVGIRRFFSDALKTHKVNIGYGKYHFGNLAISTFLTQLTPILIFGIGGYWVLKGKLSLSTIIAFDMFMAYLFSSLNSLLNMNITLQVALSALDRIYEILKYPQENYIVFNKEGKVYSIRLSNIHFKYRNREVLKGVNISAVRGEKIGIMGRSGEGKTTILKIMAGAIYHFKGNYMVNDRDLNLEEIIGLRKKIAFVTQEPLLFRGTIKYNIKLLNPIVDDTEIYKIMEKLKLHKFILSLPEGYNTYLDLKTTNLSAGQKQRIAFARAYLKNPDILLLDEITSNLDEKSEEALLSVIREINDMIVVIVSHRYKPLLLCDRVYVIKNGISKEKDFK